MQRRRKYFHLILGLIVITCLGASSFTISVLRRSEAIAKLSRLPKPNFHVHSRAVPIMYMPDDLYYHGRFGCTSNASPWIRKLVGNHLLMCTFDRVVDFHAQGTNISDKDLESLVLLPELVILELEGCHNVTNKALKTIAKLKNCKYLNIFNCPGITCDAKSFLAKAGRRVYVLQDSRE